MGIDLRIMEVPFASGSRRLLRLASRRSFVRTVGAGLALVIFPSAFCEERADLRRVAWFGGDAVPKSWVDAFRIRLAEQGFADGRTVEIRLFSALTTRSLEERRSAVKLVFAWRPSLIVVAFAEAAMLVKEATISIPVLFALVADPIATGLVRSLRSPGGNLTGATTHYATLAGKRIELARELLPKARRVAVVYDSGYINATPGLIGNLETIAKSLSLELAEVPAGRGPTALAPMIEALYKIRPDAALIVTPLGAGPSAGTIVRELLDFQARARSPWIDDSLESVEDGFLIALGESHLDHFRRVADMATKILRGQPSASLPVDEPSRVQIWVNRSAARSMGLAIPASILVRADRTID